LNQLFINKSKADISVEDEEILEVLDAKIDSLYEMQEPTIEEIEKAEKLLDEKETLYASIFIQKGFSKSIVC
jgi:phosphotransacetylase